MEKRELLELKHTEWALIKATRMYCEKIVQEKDTSKDLMRDFNVLRYCATSIEAIHRVIREEDREADEPWPLVAVENELTEDVSRQELETDRDVMLRVSKQIIDALQAPDSVTSGFSTVKTALDVLYRVSRAVAEGYEDLLQSEPGLSVIMQNPFT